jgi:hypothetical protein
MLEVTAIRKVTRPSYQTFQTIVRLNGADKLTPKTARAALEVAFGSSTYGEVWITERDAETGETIDEYGYRVYPNTARKIRPQW